MYGAGAAAAPFAPTPSSGSSKSWNAQKNNVLRIVGLMLAAINTSANQPSKGLYPDSFNAFTAEQASSEDVYVLFATFVAKEYATGRAGAFTGLQQDVRGVQQEVRAMRIAQEQHAKTMLSVLTQLQSQLYNIGSNTGSPRREPTSPAVAHSSPAHSPMRSPAHSPMRTADRALLGSAVDVGGNGGLTTSAAAGATLSACGAAAGGGRAAAASSAGGSASAASNDIAAASAVRPIDVARANGGTAPPNTVALLPMSTRTAAAPRAAVVLTSQAHSQPQATSYKGLNRPQPPNLNGRCSVRTGTRRDDNVLENARTDAHGMDCWCRYAPTARLVLRAARDFDALQSANASGMLFDVVTCRETRSSRPSPVFLNTILSRTTVKRWPRERASTLRLGAR